MNKHDDVTHDRSPRDTDSVGPDVSPSGDIEIGNVVEEVAVRMPPAPSSEIVTSGPKFPDLSFLTRSAPVPEFPCDALPPMFRTLLVGMAEERSVPIGYLASASLVTIASAIGSSAHLEITPTAREPACLWTLMVGLPGSGKTPVVAATGGCLTALEATGGAQFDNEFVEMIKKDARRRKQRAISAAIDAGDELRPPPRPMLPPQPALYTCTDPTLSGILNELSQQPRGMLLCNDEITGTLADTMREPDARAALLAAYEGGPYRRVRHNFRLNIPSLQLSILGGIQPDRLERALGGDDDGLIARTLFAWPNVALDARLPRRTEAPSITLTPLFTRIIAEPTADGSFAGHAVRLSAHGRDAVEAATRRWLEIAADCIGSSRSVYVRARQQALRIALVLEITEHVLCGKAGLPWYLGEEAVRHAIMLLDRFYLLGAERVLMQLKPMQDPDEPLRILSRFISRQVRGRTFNARELRLAPRSPVRNAVTLHALLEQLESLGCIERASARRTGPGRPAGDYVAHPDFLTAAGQAELQG